MPSQPQPQAQTPEAIQFGLSSFPPELLPEIFIHLHPNDLPRLAAANRHLRRTVPAVIDYTFAIAISSSSAASMAT
ncbi:hypothetical protein HDU96_007798 [Phlyctochytrium bullatum]|nr:hypothetical protein HDU96_007798 [Phlyctochytrium bullatum]